MCKMREIPRTVSRILHVFDAALPHFTQTLYCNYWLVAQMSVALGLAKNSAVVTVRYRVTLFWLGLGFGFRFAVGP